MKNNIEKFYEESIDKWRKARCNGSILLSKNTDYCPIVLGIVQRIYAKNETYHIVVVVKDFAERTKIINYLTTTENNENNEEVKKKIESKQLKILSFDFIEKHPYAVCELVIVVNSECITQTVIDRFVSKVSYRLCILNSLIEDTNVRLSLYNVCPIIPGFDQNEIEQLRLSHPVEEYQIGIDITDDTLKERLEKCDKYIIQTFNIFGSYDNVLKARLGDKSLNISASALCTQIAYDNGWNENLDMSIAINVEIDKMYNPNALNERACTVNDIIRERQTLLSDYIGKLEEVDKIIEENADKKIFIISKRGEFANEIVEYVNYNHFDSICAGHNDKLPTIPAMDENHNVILIKSGINKGKNKMLGSKAQCTRNLDLYNNNKVTALSFGQAPDKNIDADVDVIIITSPMCDTIDEYIYRLSKVRFTSNQLKVYSIYCKNTIEEKQIQNRNLSAKHLIVNKSEITTNFDENFGVIVVD